MGTSPHQTRDHPRDISQGSKMDMGTDEAAMAEMMGFSSFGGPDRPPKKRRYNPGADAATAAAAQRTGSNSTPLGARKELKVDNQDRIDLRDVDDDAGNHGDQVSAVASLLGAPPATLPQRPATSLSKPANSHQDPPQALRTAPWYEGYYDTLSNFNPWAKLEKKLGLEPLGNWPKQPHAQPRPTRSIDPGR